MLRMKPKGPPNERGPGKPWPDWLIYVCALSISSPIWVTLFIKVMGVINAE